MYLSPNSEDSWSIRPWHENPDNARYETADLAACAFQSVLKLLTATVASPTLYLSPNSDDNWSIKP